MENFDGYNHTVFATRTVTGAAANYVIPQPPSISGLGTSVNVDPDEVELKNNGADVIFIAMEGIATVLSKPIPPGETKRFSGGGRNTLSALPASGSQELQITAFYR